MTREKEAMASIKDGTLVAVVLAGLGVLCFGRALTQDDLCQRVEHPVVTRDGKRRKG